MSTTTQTITQSFPTTLTAREAVAEAKARGWAEHAEGGFTKGGLRVVAPFPGSVLVLDAEGVQVGAASSIAFAFGIAEHRLQAVAFDPALRGAKRDRQMHLRGWASFGRAWSKGTLVIAPLSSGWLLRDGRQDLGASKSLAAAVAVAEQYEVTR